MATRSGLSAFFCAAPLKHSYRLAGQFVLGGTVFLILPLLNGLNLGRTSLCPPLNLSTFSVNRTVIMMVPTNTLAVVSHSRALPLQDELAVRSSLKSACCSSNCDS